MRNKVFKSKTFVDSLNNAVQGLRYSFRSEKNFRFHILACILVLLASLFMDISRTELILIFLTITSVIVAELFNTAIEVVVNVIIKVYHPKARIIKDLAAAAVLVASMNAVIVGYLIFLNRIETGVTNLVGRLRNYPPNIILISVLVTIFLVIIVKILSNRGTPFKGGIPSGHTAIAFAITTAITLWLVNIPLTVLCLTLSFLIAHSRIEGRIHSFIEVIAGAVLGTLVTLFIFSILYF